MWQDFAQTVLTLESRMHSPIETLGDRTPPLLSS
jgi:hypothetical protein